MIERLFKAKRIDNGEWVEGYYFCMVHNDGRHIHHFIIPLGVDLSLGTPIEKIQIEIDVNTLCQYTGLTDDGEKIWEYDILRTYDCTIEDYIVVWSTEKGAYVIASTRKIEDKYTLKVGNVIYEEHEDLVYEVLSEGGLYPEVIGNIFDNAELLEG